MSNNIKKAKSNNKNKCSRCLRSTEPDQIYMIDDKPVCSICLYEKATPFNIYPIGLIKNDLELAKTGFGTLGKKGVSCIELLNSQKPFLYKLEDEKRITIVYHSHFSNNRNYELIIKRR